MNLLRIVLIVLLIGGLPGVSLAAQPLISVSHDATLTGNGTASSPLRVVPSGAFGLRVVDSNGVLVGNLLSQDLVTRQINGTLLAFGFLRDGISSPVYVLYTSSDCTGASYLDGRSLPIGAGFDNGTLYYPDPANLQVLTANSFQALTSGVLSSCVQITLPGSYGPIVTSPLVLTPPFHLE
jgi:hypothetical protein